MVLTAGREGLLSLTAHPASLADTPGGTHIPSDECHSLEEGSAELIVEKR